MKKWNSVPVLTEIILYNHEMKSGPPISQIPCYNRLALVIC